MIAHNSLSMTRIAAAAEADKYGQTTFGNSFCTSIL